MLKPSIIDAKHLLSGRASTDSSENTDSFESRPGNLRRMKTASRLWRAPEERLRQPQDGASETPDRVSDIDLRLGRQLSGEPEDARLTGGTRSLMRRLMGLNMAALIPRQPRRLPVVVALPVPGKMPAA